MAKANKNCQCIRFLRRQRKDKEQCKRKRQTFVYNPEEEVWHEPYMRDLRKEFSDVSILCDSKIELPWKDIALPAAGMKIRKEYSLTPLTDHEGNIIEENFEDEPPKKESTGIMVLPWKDLIITETVQSKNANLESCDSALEIPWNDITLEAPMEIRPGPEGESCATDDVEIPWNDIMIPQNIVIETQKKRQHPSSKYPPRSLKGTTCSGCKLCCAKMRSRGKRASCN